MYIYPRNDPINWFDSGGQQAVRKSSGVGKSVEECEKILDEIEHKMKELSKYVENAMRGQSPLADLQGQIGKPGGHMCELEERMHGIDEKWREFFAFGCGQYEELIERRERACSSEQLA